jgi:hypothetical protein
VELFEFTQILKELVDFYERKEPKQGTTELWFDKVKRIPSEPIRWMLQKIQDEHEAFPRNVPGALWGAFREWQQAYPERIDRKDYFDCPDCTDGLIWAKQIKNGIPYGYVFRCARCKQNNCQQYPMTRLDEIKADYEIRPKKGWPYTPKQGRTVKQLVAGIGGNHG